MTPSPLLARDKPFYIVLNTRSGSGAARDTQEVMREILLTAGQRHEFMLIEDTREVQTIAQRAAQAAKENDGAVVVGGGDGTINAAAHAVLDSGRPFGVVPQGTFNYLSRTYGIPSDPADATHALLNARLRPVQVGTINDRIFLVNASLGLYPQLLEEREHATRQFGRSRAIAIWSGLATLLKGHRQLTLEIEHDAQREIVRTPTVFIGNNPLQLERVGLPEADDVERHRLAAVVVRPVSTRELLWLALRGALGQLGDDSNVRNFPFRELRVKGVGRTRGAVRVAIDGEIVRLQPPLTFAIADRPLMLMLANDEAPASS
jgi:diacylglycerol kinase family enzyme